MLWFDVGIKRYTTGISITRTHEELWFDVGIKRYTTLNLLNVRAMKLWFDVGIKRYTTYLKSNLCEYSCGLMQESKDIQQGAKGIIYPLVVV